MRRGAERTSLVIKAGGVPGDVDLVVGACGAVSPPQRISLLLSSVP